MPKIVQCANCRKAFLGTSYTLMEHFQKCITEKIVKNKSDIQFVNKGQNKEIKPLSNNNNVSVKRI